MTTIELLWRLRKERFTFFRFYLRTAVTATAADVVIAAVVVFVVVLVDNDLYYYDGHFPPLFSFNLFPDQISKYKQLSQCLFKKEWYKKKID